MSRRYLNPAIAFARNPAVKKIPHGFRYPAQPGPCQKIIDKLDLKAKYPSGANLDIVDLYAGYGLFSTMVNYELRPRTHVIVENTRNFAPMWKDRIDSLQESTQNAENFVLYPHDPYDWLTYDHMVNRDNVVSPLFQPRTKVHDELLIIANAASSTFGESLFAQWLMCALYHNWLQKYGNVRMLCFVPEASAMKFTLHPGFPKRNKTAAKLDLYTDTRLVAVTELEDGFPACLSGYDPRRFLKDDPVLFPLDATLPLNKPFALFETVPKDCDSPNIDYYEHVLKNLFFVKRAIVRDAIGMMGPGAADDLIPLIPQHLLDRQVVSLGVEDFQKIIDVFLKWPFKPQREELLDVSLPSAREL